MKLVKAGSQYINIDAITHFELASRYDEDGDRGARMQPAVHIYFTSGGTGENSTSIILFGEQRREFLEGIGVVESIR